MDIVFHPAKGLLINGIPAADLEIQLGGKPKPPPPPPVAKRPTVPAKPPKDREVRAITRAPKIPSSFLLPAGTRYMEEENNLLKFLVEVRPSIVTFNFTRYSESTYKSVHGSEKVAVPWQYFWVYIQRLPASIYNTKGFTFYGAAIYWAQDRIVDLNSPAYLPIIPNINKTETQPYHQYGRGTICWGAGNQKLAAFVDIASTVEAVIEGFYEMRFNSSMWEVPFNSVKKWAEMSKADPYFWMVDQQFTRRAAKPIKDWLAQSKPKGG